MRSARIGVERAGWDGWYLEPAERSRAELEDSGCPPSEPSQDGEAAAALPPGAAPAGAMLPSVAFGS